MKPFYALCLALAATAATAAPAPFFPTAEVIRPRVAAALPDAEQPQRGGVMNVRAQAAPAEQVTLLSDTTVNAATGEKVARTRYEYDEYGYPKGAYEEVVDATTGEWVAGDIAEYYWNAAGYLVEQVTISAAEGNQRTLYVLSAHQEVLRITNYTLVETDWVPYSRIEYAYNDATGDVTVESHWAYDSSYLRWMEQTRYEGVYDDKGQLVEYTEYKLNEYYQLVPTKILYTYYENGLLESETTQKVDPNSYTMETVNHMKRTYTYNDLGKRTKHAIEYWNSELESWAGGNGNRNVNIDYSYDTENRLTSEYYTEQQEVGGEFTPVQEYEYLYEPDDTGIMNTTTQYRIRNGNKSASTQNKEHVLPWGGIDFRQDSYDMGMGLTPQSETVVTFDDNRYIIEFVSYRYDFMGNKSNGNKTEYVRDARGNFTEMVDYNGVYGSSDPDAWNLYRKVTQAFTEDGEVLDYAVYMYNQGTSEWELNARESFEYNYDMLTRNLLTWFSFQEFKYQVTSFTEQYTTNVEVTTLTYSDPEKSGIVSVETDLEGTVEVYNLLGVRVATAEADMLSGTLSTLPTGVYIATDGRTSRKIAR